METAGIRPLHDWILVRMDPIETQVGSIFIPEGTDNRKATVVAVGPGAEAPDGLRQPVGVEPGDRIVFNRAHGEHRQGKTLLQLLGDDFLLLRQRDVLVVFSGELQVS